MILPAQRFKPALAASWRDLASHWRNPTSVSPLSWSQWSLLALAGAGLLGGVSLVFDVADVRAIADFDPRVVDVFQIVTKAGQSGWLFALSILTLAYAHHRQADAAMLRLRARWGLLASRALYVFAVQAFSGFVSQIVKHLVGRARPRLFETLGAYHFDVFSLKAVLASFPSGHTTTVFAAAASLAFFTRNRAARLVLALFAQVVATSRLIIGAHYPSDVLGGALLGLGSALLVARVFGRRKIAFELRDGELLPRPRLMPKA